MRAIGLASTAALAFLMCGCVKHSVVIKVKADGSAVVHLRHFEEESSILSKKKKKGSIPSKEDMQKLAQAMGKGVSLRTIETKRDANGWSGYEVFFDVKNVNHLALDGRDIGGLMQVSSGDDKNGGEPSDSGPFPGASLTKISFHHTDGILTIKPQYNAKDDTAKKAETIDPFAGTASTASFPNKVALAMAQPFLGAARAGLFVQVEPGIKESNAKFVRGKLISLLSVNFGQLLSQKNAEQNIALLDELVATSGDAEKAQAVCNKIRGLHVDMTPKIIVRTR